MLSAQEHAAYAVGIDRHMLTFSEFRTSEYYPPRSCPGGRDFRPSE